MVNVSNVVHELTVNIGDIAYRIIFLVNFGIDNGWAAIINNRPRITIICTPISICI